MIVLHTAQLMIKTKYYKNNNGIHTFQRRVPDKLRPVIKKNMITVKLIGKESSMVAEITKHTRNTDKMFEDALDQLNKKTPLLVDAIDWLAKYGLEEGSGNYYDYRNNKYSDQPHLDVFYSDLAESESLNDVQLMALNLLKNPAPITLHETLDIYLKHHPKGTNPKFAKETTHQTTSVMKTLGKFAVQNISRSQVREFIDQRCTEVKTGTVDREISVIRAAMNIVIMEKGLDIKNPFIGQTIPNEGHDKVPRIPFDKEETKVILKACLSEQSDIKNILLLGLLTGSRLSELVGLRRVDVRLDDALPHICIVPHEGRSLKTKTSKRDTPLVPLAINVLTQQLAYHDGPMVFPKYTKGSLALSDNASATVNKLIKRLGIQGKTMHCTRHTVRDMLTQANTPFHLMEAIGGWGSNSVGQDYGKGYALKQKLKALTKGLSLYL